MENLQFFNATGVRQPKSVNENVIIAESTRASFKLMPAICAKLGLNDGDFVTMQMTKDDSGVVNGVYVGKGRGANYQKDAEGNFILDDRKRKVAIVGQEGFGALASEQQAGSNIIKISVASAWDVIGSSDVKKHYSLSTEGVDVNLPVGDGTMHTTTLYKLEFVKDEAKVERATAKKEGQFSNESFDKAIAAYVPTPATPVTPEQAFEVPADDSEEF